MNILDAAYNTVHDYPGGSESLAPRMGASAAVLRNKVNPNNTTHHLTLLEANELMGKTGDFRILQALAGNHSFALRELGGATDEGQGQGVLQSFLRASAAQGDFARTLDAALADNRITANEQRQLEDQIIAMQGELTRLSSRIAESAAACRPDLRAVG